MVVTLSSFFFLSHSCNSQAWLGEPHKGIPLLGHSVVTGRKTIFLSLFNHCMSNSSDYPWGCHSPQHDQRRCYSCLCCTLPRNYYNDNKGQNDKTTEEKEESQRTCITLLFVISSSILYPCTPTCDNQILSLSMLTLPTLPFKPFTSLFFKIRTWQNRRLSIFLFTHP